MALAGRCARRLHLLLCSVLAGAARPPQQVPAGCSAPLLSASGQRGVRPTVPTRPLVTKKGKAKDKGQSQARVTVDAASVEDVISLEEVNAEMLSVMEALKEDFSKNLSIRTSAGALEHIIVTTKDGKFPLNQLGQISQKSPQHIIVNMSSFPESTAAAIKAIKESRMNLNPEVDGQIIQVPVPKVTREYRESLVKLAKQHTNKAKDSLRWVRSNAMSCVKKAKSTVSEDTIWQLEKQIQQMTDDTVAEMDKLLAAKTNELLV
ncbi:ribosome-recycling factor, mitochondrial isoform X1 [Alligator mississippiensis]|uniref:Ribosome-recycling factor, mitochondrial n=1 Tax=Alligator mississippiensis TaxID=8496 RepID=A0A151MG31_ALLMI|nr:ribosome-recycling factor, mitochondrial isoform X1 [Alligator mississippiensis]KYO23463.1 ribosome-recycling factor, mitochondrial [Alligator mississippiensis]